MATLEGLLPFGLGIVAVTKEDGKDVVKYFPPDKLSLSYGDPSQNQQTISVDVPDASGKKHKMQAVRSEILEATWFPGGNDNRITPPDVVVGETIEIFRYKDSKVHYWKSVLREPKLRRLEHVVYAYSNIPSGREAFDSTSSYGAVWSTKDKKVSFYTSQSNGEAFAYEFKIDTAGSTWSLWDNVGNGFGIESNTNQVYMRTASGAFWEISDSKSSGSLPGGLDVTTPKAAFSDTVTAGKMLVTAKLVLGKSKASSGSVPDSRVMRALAAFSNPREYKQGTEGYELEDGSGMVMGNDCLMELGHQSGVELGDDSHVKMMDNSSVELGSGSNITLGTNATIQMTDGQILVEGKDVIEFLKRLGF